MNTITLEYLRKSGLLPQGQKKVFLDFFPNGMPLTGTDVEFAESKGLNLDLLVNYFTGPESSDAYRHANAVAFESYRHKYDAMCALRESSYRQFLTEEEILCQERQAAKVKAFIVAFESTASN